MTGPTEQDVLDIEHELAHCECLKECPICEWRAKQLANVKAEQTAEQNTPTPTIEHKP
jgi:hypothetical protein